MQFLDVRTLSVVTGITALAMSVCMLHVGLRRKIYPGFGYWGAAFLANFVGMVALGVRNYAPDLFSVLMANCFIVLAALLLCRGLAVFSGAKELPWLDIAALASLIGIQTYFTVVENNVHMRAGFLGLWLAVFYFRAAWLVYFPVTKLLGQCNYMLAWSLAGISLIAFWGGMVALLWHTSLSDLMKAGAPYGVSIVAYLALSTMIMIGLISINSSRLELDLTSANSEIIDLKRFLPICANCKKIRDDKGYWQQVERYLQEHTGAEMTHSICPDCAAQLYPELAKADIK